jgi:hypothetical protein
MNKKIDLQIFKPYEEMKFMYNFYMIPSNMERLKEIKQLNGIPISTAINQAIFEYYKKNVKK